MATGTSSDEGGRLDGSSLTRLPNRIGDLAVAGLAVARTGVVRPVRPDRLAAMGVAALRNGPTVATASIRSRVPLLISIA